jgi:hypothetical protein
VTVLFADVVHSMDIAAAVGAERLREIMAELVSCAAVVVQRYGGTVDEFTGDGIMAVFGAQVALEDHAIRACLAGLDVQEEAKRLAVDVQDRDGTVTLFENYCGVVGFGAVVMDQLWVAAISGGSVERGNLTPDHEAVGHFGSPSGRAGPMASGPKVCGDPAEGRQEPLGMAHRFKAFHRPFTLSGGLMRVLGAIVRYFDWRWVTDGISSR